MEQSILIPQEPTKFISEIAEAVAAKLKASTETQPDNLTQSEACKLMNVCKATLIAWQNKGFITVRKVGRRAYYSRKQLLSTNLKEEGGKSE